LDDLSPFILAIITSKGCRDRKWSKSGSHQPAIGMSRDLMKRIHLGSEVSMIWFVFIHCGGVFTTMCSCLACGGVLDCSSGTGCAFAWITYLPYLPMYIRPVVRCGCIRLLLLPTVTSRANRKFIACPISSDDAPLVYQQLSLSIWVSE